MHQYKAKLVRVVDGDTLDLSVDLGFNITINERFRLYGIDTPETRTRDLEEKEQGLKAKQFVIDNLKDREIYIDTFKGKGKYGRWLAKIFYKVEENGLINLNDLLVSKGLAKTYFGGRK